ncbi:hypothetical protein A2291_02790 [candidate division WOR-1 bacterium RIFOXYB2_FULL_42_35]|uniref:HTH arsR-type domain-containing protein n=1 Tax=candidate division WOR-1 bacterium RIFOXYC2_FULL_41_25 TaxID=1802586 RepID=A0A1F4TMY5_UNCSA|nr:MAG: hypothetical protein A2247_04920 [candidate division WOR-1 bacterium RIFOXYA2_FULL_41_14]OGC23120.1 MAG: hypothetical protein A2291_02790 [candidate division WOR-1 bacterium RIFOXYB2_FULL_42_35]OGC33967.1 MAG: hypothetical protein A2462_07625 [candidate division WOR-1 bacterium RIFOXYC2_FULL_41_25]
MVYKNKCCRADLGPIAKTLRVISEPSRLKILCLLKEGERCVCEIQEQLSQKHNLVCHHLKTLVKLGLLKPRKQSGFTYYGLNHSKYKAMVAAITGLLRR